MKAFHKSRLFISRCGLLMGLALLSHPSFSGPKTFCLDRHNWDERMTVEDYMEECDGAMVSKAGCNLNIEKVCINGVEVNLLKDSRMASPGALKIRGFNARMANGLDKSDFSNPSKMYNVVPTLAGKPLSLCSKIEGLSEEETRYLNIRSLPRNKNYIIDRTYAKYI